MTDILLTIIAVLLFVRIVLQGKSSFEKWCCAPCEVENVVKVVNADDPIEIKKELDAASEDGLELVSTHQPNIVHLYLFFTRKKIRNYYED